MNSMGTDTRNRLVDALAIMAGLLVVVMLLVVGRFDYMLFHVLTESASAAVGFVVFAIAWNSRETATDGFLVFLGTAFLFIGLVDTLHALAYRGMHVFPFEDANIATQLWVVARAMQAAGFVIAPWMFGRKPRPSIYFAGWAAVAILAIGAIFWCRMFPDCFIESQGLTRFKVWSEYGIIATLIIALIRFHRLRTELDATMALILQLAIVATIASEMAFTLYDDPFGAANMAGHLLKIAAVALTYEALVRRLVREPVKLLFQRLTSSEQNLRETAAKLRAQYEGLPIPTFTWQMIDGSLVLADFNEAARIATRGGASRFLGAKAMELYENQQDVLDSLRHCMVEQTSCEREVHYYVHSLDVVRTMDMRFAYVPPDLVLMHADDVTERRKIERSLEESEERYRVLVEGTRDIVAKVSPEGTVRYANRAGVELLGFDAELPVGLKAMDVVHKGDVREVVARLRGWVDDSEAESTTIECRVLARDGTSRVILWNAAKETDASGKVATINLIGKDITDLRVAQEERERLMLHIRQSEHLETMGTLAGGVAHNLSNLLQGIMGNLDMVLMDLPTSHPVRKNLLSIQESAERGAKLSTQMLELSGRGRFLLRQINLGEFVAEMCPLLEKSVGDGTILVFDLAKDIPEFSGDPSQIRRMLQNLVSNSHEALGESGGTVTIETGACTMRSGECLDLPRGHELPDGALVKLTVRDSGPGVAADALPRVFDPFFSTRGRGRGLGLAAVMGGARAHGGTAIAENVEDGGFAVHVYFPIDASK